MIPANDLQIQGHVDIPAKDVSYRIFMICYKDGSADYLRVVNKGKLVNSIVEFNELNRSGVAIGTYRRTP